MEVYRRSSGLLLLLGLFLLATTLQGVQGEAESEGPSESECRPYIEKALKELETGESTTGSLETGDSKEDVPTVEVTDDSDHQEGEGDNDSNEGQENTESVEETVATKQPVEPETSQVKKSEEAAIEDKSSEVKKDESLVQPDEATSDHNKSEENEPTESKEIESIVTEKYTENEGSQEEVVANGDEADSTEEGGDEIKTDDVENDDEDNEESEEAPDADKEPGSQEAQEEPDKLEQEEAEDDIEEFTEKSSEDDTSQEHAEITEKSSEDEVAQEESSVVEDRQDAKVVEEAEDIEEQVEEKESPSEQQEDKETEQSKEESEASEEQIIEEKTESTEQVDSKEELEEVEESTEHPDESQEQQQESKEDTGENKIDVTESGEVSAEGSDEPSDQEEIESKDEEFDDKEQGDTAGSEEKDEDSKETKKSEAEESTETLKEGIEELGDATEDKNDSKEGDDDTDDKPSEEDEQKDEETRNIEEEEDDNEKKEENISLGDSSVENEKSEDVLEESEEKSSESEGSVPVEDLSLDIETPSDLRPRDHVEQLLKLDDQSSKTENIINQVSEITLKELKRLYENAIKPLEVLYRYRDLSNRHFGDSEIFSKPLILFMGPWSGGKSSIINYLINNEYNETSLRTGAEPSPAYFNILMHGEEPEVLDGTQLAADFTFSGLQKFGQGLEERLRGLKLPTKLLQKVNIVEIPGILEVRKQVSRVFPFNDACQWFIDRADIIFLVYDPSKLDVGPETEAILDQLKGREHQTRIVLNKADQVKPEELMRVQGALIWNISPLMSSPQPPVMYTTSLWSRPYESWAPIRLLQAQERAFLRDLRGAIQKRIENKIASARRFAVRVRNHAKMVDCYLTTYYNHKSVFGNRKQVADEIIEHPQDYHIYEGLSTLTNISRYDLPDPDVYRGFFKLNPLYEFQQLSATCTYFRGCPINRLDVAIAYDLPELVGAHKKRVESALAVAANQSTSAPGS